MCRRSFLTSDHEIAGRSELLRQQAANIPLIVIEERLGKRDGLFDYDYEYGYGIVSFHRVCVTNTHHDRLGTTEPLTACTHGA